MFKCKDYIHNYTYFVTLLAFLACGVGLPKSSFVNGSQKGACGKLTILISEEEPCYINSTFTTCPDTSLLGTVIIKRCRSFYRSGSENITYLCTENGWITKGKYCQSECGLKRIETMTADGKLADENEYPWTVAIYKNGIHYCSGTIISPYHVVTGAHCISKSYEPGNITIRAGKYPGDSEIIDGVPQIRKVKRTLVPPNYLEKTRTYRNDIGIIEIDEAFDFTSAVLPICIDWNSIYEDSDFTDNNEGEFAVWELHTAGDPMVLRKLTVLYRNRDSCVHLPQDFKLRYFSNDKFCVGSDNNESSICKGNSGGGLYFKSDKKKYFLRGIASVAYVTTFPVRCATSNYTLYTKVSSHLNWIREEMLQNKHFKINFVTIDFATKNGEVVKGECGKLNTLISEEELCYINSTAETCPDSSTVGTIIIKLCRPEYSSGLKSITYLCTDNGWSTEGKYCLSECGLKRIGATPLIVGGEPADENEYPWVVALFQDNKDNYFCSGTIISPYHVLTAAHCITDRSANLQDYRNFTVVAGKYYRDLKIVEGASQIRKVKRLAVPSTYAGRFHNYVDDIGIIETNEAFNFTSVLPICMDWNSRYEKSDFKDGNKGEFTGWGYTHAGGNPSKVLKKLNIPYRISCVRLPVPFREQYLSYDKFCGGYLDSETSPCVGDSGSGLYFKSDKKRYFLRGIISTLPKRENYECEINNYQLYTIVSHYLNWIREEIARNKHFKIDFITKIDENLRNGCFLPDHIQYGRFSMINGDDYIVNKLVAISSIILLSCSDGSKDVSMFFYCQDMKWIPPIEEVKCKTPGTCPSIKSSVSEEVFCKLNGVAVDCNDPQTNTTAIIRCQPFFNFQGHNPIYKCENETWDQVFIPCRPECGVKRPSTNTLIVGGNETNENEYPWVVAIYDRRMEQICGGTIISRSFIISAAHCFANEAGQVKNTDDYLIGAGKYFRSLDEKEPSTQTSKIKTLFVHEDYRGRLQKYRDDIALIELHQKLVITLQVQPICIDWETHYEDFDFIDENEGIIVGWGNTEEGLSPSPVLRKLVVPYRSKRVCHRHLPADYAHEFLSSDKICGGYLNNDRSACNGDSGGGLYFRSDNGKYYLRGITSVAARGKVGCDINQYILFTKLSKYIPWIETKTRRIL